MTKHVEFTNAAYISGVEEGKPYRVHTIMDGEFIIDNDGDLRRLSRYQDSIKYVDVPMTLDEEVVITTTNRSLLTGMWAIGATNGRTDKGCLYKVAKRELAPADMGSVYLGELSSIKPEQPRTSDDRTYNEVQSQWEKFFIDEHNSSIAKAETLSRIRELEEELKELKESIS